MVVSEPMTTIDARFSTSVGQARRAVRKTAVTFVSTISRNAASGVDSIEPWNRMPALSTSASRPPSRLIAPSSALSAAARSVRSQRTKRAPVSLATALPRASLRPEKTTSAPSARSRSTQARPMPDVPPVR